MNAPDRRRRVQRSRVIDAPATRIHDILVAAPELPDWNPAFVRVEGPARATTGIEYRLGVIRGLRGTLTYTRIDADVIAMSWAVPFLSETATWTLTPHATPHQTRVTHEVERLGALAAFLGHSLDTLPELRLERLAQRAAARSRLGEP
ncbi:SRPBCC family protein [Actinophytocola gossypii]|uniref:SRPBCC family protein n=1 Tax=Actinophytocola gossypii TaxID=2812003 RepID=A0ABT2J4L9_9PSEU|nr:SRPBCC family protein [Actinophytocola gossypii]MCT2582234.1 SRPBCC family protein [Actinophytocola gossypii]